jgi:hypothetical protein
MYYVHNTVTPAGEDKSALPSSGIDVYYVPNLNSLGIEKMYELPSGDEIIKSNTTVTTNKHAFIPTLGDMIELIPFLPIEINIPNVISSMMNFFSWMINRRPQDQTTPRIYFVLKKSLFRNVSLEHGESIVSVPYYNHPSHGSLITRLLLPVYRSHAA